jgi:hypothetical protein
VDDPQAARLAKNEAMFRRVNEAIEALSRESDETIEWSPISFVCECGALECARVIDVQRAAYEAVRAQPKQFIVVPGHERVDVEAVIERRDDYLVVEKREPTAAEIAEQTDPRN